MCYDLVRPDVALELAWRHNAMDFAMPFVVQVLKEYVEKVDLLASDHTERKAAEEAAPAVPHMPVTQVCAYTPLCIIILFYLCVPPI